MNTSSKYSYALVKRILASGAIGNILETYDLILITLLAATLGNTFFPPAETPYAHVTNVLYVFLIGLLVRPIGNILMGIYADQVGRKRIMIISLIFTGCGTILIGFLPSYSQIGYWSTALFIILRIFQNFFAGIEYINSATYLIEASKENTRGYYVSWTAIGISGGYLLASIVALIVTYFISKGFIPKWGWRFIFLFSIVGIIFGFYIRKSIPESLAFILNNSEMQPIKKHQILKNSFKYILNNPRQCLCMSAITLMGICLTYIYYIYIPINLITFKHFSTTQTFALNSISLMIVVLLIPFFGKISDFINRITLLKVTCGVVFVLAIPFFWLNAYGSYIEILLITLLISIPASCFFSLYPVIITECFPSKIRCTTASVIYQIIVSIQMGTLPLIVPALIKLSKIEYSPAFLLMFSTLIGYIGLNYFKRGSVHA